MYRTAVVTAYDVMDSVHVKATITEYNDLGNRDVKPVVTEVVSTVRSKGHEDPSLWLWEAIQSLQVALDNR
jgi:hypothetical protein